MHDASSGLGLISVDLAGVCVCMYSCEAVRGGPAVVPFVRNGSQAGPMTRSALAAAGRSEEKNVDSSAPNTKHTPNQMNHVDLTD